MSSTTHSRPPGTRAMCDDGFGNDGLFHGGFDIGQIAWRVLYHLYGRVGHIDRTYDLC